MEKEYKINRIKYSEEDYESKFKEFTGETSTEFIYNPNNDSDSAFQQVAIWNDKWLLKRDLYSEELTATELINQSKN